MDESCDDLIGTAVEHKIINDVQGEVTGDLANLLVRRVSRSILVDDLAEVDLLELFELVELLTVSLKKLVDILDIFYDLLLVFLDLVDRSSLRLVRWLLAQLLRPITLLHFEVTLKLLGCLRHLVSLIRLPIMEILNTKTRVTAIRLIT